MIDCQRIYQLAGLFAWSLLLPEMAAASELSPSAEAAASLPATSVLSSWVAEAVAAEGQAAPEVSGDVGVGRAAPTPTGPDVLNSEDASQALETTKVVVGAAKRDRNEGSDALVWLESVAAQASRPTSGVQDDALGPLSSTHSGDLQLIETVPAVTDVIQAPRVQPASLAQATTTPSPSDEWHFLLVPYVYVPLSISGSANYEGSEEFRNDFSGNLEGSRDFDFTPTQIRSSLENSLNFAFLGGFEAWTPDYNLGVLANIDYLSLTSDDTLNRAVRRPGFANFVPTELNASLDTQIWNVDLAASYRFYDPAQANPQGLNTEYDLGPWVFDVLGGLNITSLNTQLDLSTNLGGEGEFSTSKTVVSPLLGGRFRWNATPELAVLLSGSVSGFGIGGLTQYGVLGGVNWMFSGNTSVGLGYRFGFLDYDSGSSEVDLNVDQNGPYLNFGFRF
jgi:hypothetical protein